MRHLTRVTRRGTAVALAVSALVVLAAGCDSGGEPAAAKAAPEPAASASAVALPAPRSAPGPAATLTPAARAGEVRVEPGPFTDRVTITGLKLTGASSAAPAVTGRLRITTDVSHVLALELRAAYYDGAGRLLGTGEFTYQEEGEDAHGHEVHAEGSEAATGGIAFTVPAKKLTGTPAAAVLSVPVLVNE
ncbi:hypothetical protein [Streptomyces paludis]|uniref:DUF4352 domain-containing protein n=1 Tax=Streptomyces paludis TaxID=2282738 RepID=A0A345HX30_9ACTN|nr:hypothetical protein [Streptomyces paludis]AXG81254.1 hypothetical protein DVK44_30165 [Streptomyces paludis]